MDKDNELIIKIKISPGASKNEIIKTADGTKIKITTPPVDGKANKVLVDFLAKKFKIPKTSVSIIKGETSREKTILFKVSNSEKISFIKDEL